MKQTDKINEIYKTARTLFVVAAVTFFLLGLFIGFLAGVTYPRESSKPEVKSQSVVRLLREQHKDELTPWELNIMAIFWTESKCNPNAVGKAGDSGVMQLIPVYVQEVNRISGRNYAHTDAFSIRKSLESAAWPLSS